MVRAVEHQFEVERGSRPRTPTSATRRSKGSDPPGLF
jgi:hypothetical protein